MSEYALWHLNRWPSCLEFHCTGECPMNFFLANLSSYYFFSSLQPSTAATLAHRSTVPRSETTTLSAIRCRSPAAMATGSRTITDVCVRWTGLGPPLSPPVTVSQETLASWDLWNERRKLQKKKEATAELKLCTISPNLKEIKVTGGNGSVKCSISD